MEPGDDDGDGSERGFPDEDELLTELEDVSLTPSDHQRIKDLVNGPEMDRIRGDDRRYLVAGAGGETGAATRRGIVYDRLDARTDPPAVAMQLEDFGLTPEDIELWTRVFDILCGRATHIVAVIEDFDGGYVWELGLLFAPTYRDKTWVLKRRYPDPETERERYDNGMAASYVELLLTGDRAYEWLDADELRDVVDEVP
ncbi:hypothetical protein NP511_11290 [Natrinema thermotolerans]|uniref:Uncharacterized protein n=1 Tax=Natrinema thermotolerans TaxID=121872 RepID=A0AAF0T0D7_9EURY|nr:hypothetical protein [Natrinema thermotolerans]QCC59027.1 hypothetical protein DVR14_10430 [Natrinema thermotolerans]WMT05972.1 hypothetical protein NP511_11290 [Natrinema thermotolerans]